MTNALASRTSASTEGPIRPIRNPSVEPPKKVQRTEKLPGSIFFKDNKVWVVQTDGSITERVR